MTIEEAQIKVDDWIKEYGVRYFDEMTNMALLVEEVGEVARIMARTYGQGNRYVPKPVGRTSRCNVGVDVHCQSNRNKSDESIRVHDREENSKR